MSGRQRPKRDRNDLAGLPLVDEVWEAGSAPMRTELEPSEDMPMAAVLIVDVDTVSVVGVSVDGEEGPAAVVAAVTATMRTPLNGTPRRPSVVRVRDTAAGRRLEKVLPPGTEVEYADRLPFVEDVAAGLASATDAGGDEEPDLEDAAAWLTEEFFDAAATWYEAEPWSVLDPLTMLQLRVGDGEPFVASVLGGDPGEEIGLTIFPSMSDFGRLLGAPPTDLTVLTVAFSNEVDVYPPLAQARRDAGWRLADASAFPTAGKLTAADPDGIVTPDEARTVTAALRTIPVIATRLRAGRDARSERIRVSDVHGNALDVSLVAVIDASEETGDAQGGGEPALELFPHDEDAGSSPDESASLLGEAIERIARLPDAARIGPRLRWTFFLGPGPDYVGESDVAIEDAHVRFSEWAYLSARPAGGKTLLERMLDDARDEMPAERLRALEHVATPRHSHYVVTRANARDMTVRDVLRRETLVVRVDPISRPLKRGERFLGSLFPCLDATWRLGGSVVPVKGEGNPAGGPPDPDVAPLLVEHVLGASTDWIDDIGTIAELSQVWTMFRDDFELGGMQLPTLAKIQRHIRKAAVFEDVWRLFERRAWWYDEELNICGRMVQRAWNLTPREELGGISPLAAVEAHIRESGGHRRSRGRRRR